MSEANKVTLGLILACVACALSYTIGRVHVDAKIITPMRWGDHVIVTSGFFTGQSGRIVNRQIVDGRVQYRLEFDNPKIYGDFIDESKMTLINTFEKDEP